MKRSTCPDCGDKFKTPQALGAHRRYKNCISQEMGERAVDVLVSGAVIKLPKPPGKQHVVHECPHCGGWIETNA